MKGFKAMREIQGDMYSQGQRMGFAKGGAVKDTGLMPASEGCNEAEKEAGGHGKLKAGYKKGGKAAKKGKHKMPDGKMMADKDMKKPAKKGKPVHKSTPMFGKGGRSC
jgi:hypothetical protein